MKFVKSYDQLLAEEKSYRILNHYRKLILRQSYDSLMIDLKIFCKSEPRFGTGNVVRRIDEVALRRARLVLRWMTVFERV